MLGEGDGEGVGCGLGMWYFFSSRMVLSERMLWYLTRRARPGGRVEEVAVHEPRRGVEVQPRDVPGAREARAAGVVAGDGSVERGADGREVARQVEQRDAQVAPLAGADDLLQHAELGAVVGAELGVAGRQPVRDVVALLGGALDALTGVDVLRVGGQRPGAGQRDGRGGDRRAEPPEVDADVDDRRHAGREELHEGEVLRVGAVLGAQVVGVDDVAAATLDLPLPVVVQHRALARRRAAEQHDERHLGVLDAQVGHHLHAVLPVLAVVVAAQLLAERGDERRREAGGGRGRRAEERGGGGAGGAVAGAGRRGDERQPREAGGQEKDEREPGRHPHGAAAEGVTSRHHRSRTA